MISRLYRLTEAADWHLAEVLGIGEDLWGPDARDRYQALQRAITDLADNPTRPGVQLLDGRIHYHLRHSRNRALVGRVRQLRHTLVSRIVDDVLVVLAVGHDAMEDGLVQRIKEGEGR